MELKTNHRFKDDPEWGNLLARFRQDGPSNEDVQLLNTRVIDTELGPSEDEIPKDVTYAVKTNLDRAAINDAIFANHLAATHSKVRNVVPPKHTVCIRASDMQWHKAKREYTPMNTSCKDIIYACCGEGHLKTKSKNFDPFMKLYYKRPVMLNENKDVENCIANGTMCEFEGVVFADGVEYDDAHKVIIDGYYVWCFSVAEIKSLKLRILDGLQDENELKYYHLKAQTIFGQVHFPLPLYATVDKNTDRFWRRCKMNLFALSVANARTVHKLQGRSITNLVISTWDYTGNWIYVALSRVKTMTGLFFAIAAQSRKL